MYFQECKQLVINLLAVQIICLRLFTLYLFCALFQNLKHAKKKIIFFWKSTWNQTWPFYLINDCSIQFKFICIVLFTIQIVAKRIYRKLSFHNIFTYCRNLIYLTYGNIWLILYTVWWMASSEVLWGVVIVSSQVFGHLRSFKGWIQTEAFVIPSYDDMLIPWQKQRKK